VRIAHECGAPSTPESPPRKALAKISISLQAQRVR
jgi:hypothetical protein